MAGTAGSDACIPCRFETLAGVGVGGGRYRAQAKALGFLISVSINSYRLEGGTGKAMAVFKGNSMK